MCTFEFPARLWMVERGARKLILNSGSGLTNSYQAYCLEKWKKLGSTVEILTADLSDKRTAEEWMAKITSDGVLGGVINSAVTLRDRAFYNQTPLAFKEVSAPKGTITENLDQLSRKYCPQLDIFVVFSSYSCGRGNPGQSNYGWANSVMERICEKRKADGLHGLAIQWGLIGQVGIAHGLFNGKDDKTLLGTTFQSIESCLEILDKALLQTHSAVVSSSMIADKEISNGERGGLMQRLQKIFGIADIQAIDPQRNLNELGMDSIVAVELKQTLEREYDVSIKKQHLAMLTVGDLRAIGEGTFDVQTLWNTQVGPNSEEIYVPFQLHDTILVQLKSHSRTGQVFMVHGAEGSSISLMPLAAKLHANVHAFQMTGKLEWNSLIDLAAHYVNEMKEKQPTGPYTIFGYSADCTIAYEMAQLLASKGVLVQDLVFLDDPPSYGHMQISESYVMELLEAMNFLKNIPQDRLEAFKINLTIEKNDIIPKSFELIISGIIVSPAQAQVYKKLYTEFGKHVPQCTYDGQVHVLEAAESASEYSPVNMTETFCTGLVTRHKVAGNHRTFLAETFVDESARIINALLTKTCA